jgi:3-isopropylmalate/(R)-2-methylmalate dehydratase small subunit
VEKFSSHTGTAVPLRRSNVDTDQIIPAVYLKRVTKTGFEDGLFAAWRSDPNFVLNQPQYAGATILIPGPDFGTGSSREHAVWALENYGFRVVIGSRFGDIFRGNSGKAGLLIAVVDQKIIEELWDLVEANPAAPLTVDLLHRSITGPDFNCDFEIDNYTRWRLLEGLDDIGLTLRQVDHIDAYESQRPAFKPKTLPAKVDGAS